jgi:hypothetical protein
MPILPCPRPAGSFLSGGRGVETNTVAAILEALV